MTLSLPHLLGKVKNKRLLLFVGLFYVSVCVFNFGYNHYTSMTVSKVIIYADEEMITVKWRDESTEEYHFPTRSDGEVFRLPQR